MNVYLASPNTQQQAHAANGMPVLVSFALYQPWMANYLPSFGRLLIDSGAYSEMTTGESVDVVAYAEWAQQINFADAWAGLDDIRGDRSRSLANYKHGGFPTWHDSDGMDEGYLNELLAISAAQGKRWIGIGMVPPREGKERFVRWACDRIPEGFHVHGFALRAFTHIARLDSVDSTNWFRDTAKLLGNPTTAHLTPAECLDIVVKRYQRWTRVVSDESETATLFAKEPA